MKKQQTTNNIKIPNKNLEILKKNFSHCFDKEGNFDFHKFKMELSKSEDIDFSNESYGMDWLGKSYARLLASDEATTLLKESEAWNTKSGNQQSENLLIKGDNLEVLKHLSNAYHEKIKMIYIDPPYNTGGDGFVYQDDRKFSIEELSKLAGIDEEKAKRILDFTQSKSNSHSAWLTFMYPRLYIAKQLLKEDGVIFVSIDDNEVAQLRMMMDEIFGEENFVGQLKWKKKKQPSFLHGHISYVTEYILVFAKNIKYLKKLSIENVSGDTKPLFNSSNNESIRCFKAGLKVNYNNGTIKKGVHKNKTTQIEFLNDVFIKNYKTQNSFSLKAKFRDGQDNINKYISEQVVFITKNNSLRRYPLKEELNKQKNILDLLLDWGQNQDAFDELLNLFGTQDLFSNPKPTKLIYNLLLSSTTKYDIILDFFAGSGTTGDAVMQINAEDNGNRKYILVQLPEFINPNKDNTSKTAYDFVKNELKIENPTIFDITKERLIRAGKKIQEEQKKNKDLFSKESKQDFGFRVFETIPNNEGNWENYILESESFDPQTKLLDENKLTEEDLKTLLTTWKTYDGFSLTQNLKEIDLDGYKGHYLDNKVYLMDKGFETKHLKKLLEEIDENKDFNPATIIVFGYNFQSKMLREIADNVKSYANKKHTDIDFITRY